MSPLSRRRFLKGTAGAAALTASGGLSTLLAGCGQQMPTAEKGSGGAASGGTIRVGILTDLTGPIASYGLPLRNGAQMAAEEVNAKGGVLGRQIELVIEDSASDPNVGVTKAKRLVQELNVAMVIGAITSSMREAVKGEITDRADKIFIYPTLYEGEDCHKNLFNTGPVPNQQVKPFIPWLMNKAGGKNVYLVSADYIWPHVTNKYVRQYVEQAGGSIVAEEYFPLDATDFSTTVQKIMASDTNVVFATPIPPGVWAFIRQMHEAGFRRKGVLAIDYLEETALTAVPPETLEDIPSCLDYYEVLDDPYDKEITARYHTRFQDGTSFTQTGTGAYRSLLLWAQAANTAGSIETAAVRKALDSAQIEQSPGGPCAMVPGQHHVSLTMYIGVFKGGKMTIAEKLGLIPPEENCNISA